MKYGYYFINTDIYNKRAHSIQIFHTIEALNHNKDLQVSLVAPFYNRELSVDEAFSYYDIKGKFKIFFVKSFLIGKVGRLSFVVYGFLSIFKLIYWKIRGKIDFIYFRSEYFWPLAIFAKILAVPYYYEIHRRGMNFKSNLVKNFLAKHAEGLITITGQLADFYKKFNKNIVVAHDAVDFVKFNMDISRNNARKELGIPLDRDVFLYTGSIKKIKGVDIIIRNAQKFPNVFFYLLGNIDSEMKKYLSKYQSKNIFAPGHVENKLMPLYMKAADLLIMPHAENIQSQSPMKLFEYLASGTAILSSDLENIREVLSDEDTVFFQGGDDSSFVGALKEFLLNKQKYEIIKDMRINKAKEYSWENRGRAISKFLLNNL